jgi:hypothetical protein
MSDTPRTDALYFPNGENATMAYSPRIEVAVAHARELERDLKIKDDQLADCYAKWQDTLRELAEARMSFRNEPPEDCAIATQCMHVGNCLGQCSLASKP